MTIGERIKQRRIELGLSVDDIAARLGKNRATIYRYENSDIENLPTTILEPLAKILDTTPAYLIGWEKELPLSQEALRIIGRFALTADRNTGYSMMDLFNAVVAHKNFEGIINEMLLYISRSEDDWQKMADYFSSSDVMKSTNAASMKALCCAGMTKSFEQLILDVLNPNRAAFNEIGQDISYVNAAHADDYANAPEELKQQEEAIMDDDNF